MKKQYDEKINKRKSLESKNTKKEVNNVNHDRWNENKKNKSTIQWMVKQWRIITY